MALSKGLLLCLETNSLFKDELTDLCKSSSEDPPTHDDIHNVGEYHGLYKKYRKMPYEFHKYTGLSVATFDYIHQEIEPHLSYSIKHGRVIKVDEKLFFTLRFLSCGVIFKKCATFFRLPVDSFKLMVLQTLGAIERAFDSRYIQPPTKDMFQQTALKFYNIFYFPNCIGALDRKLIRLTKQRLNDPTKCDTIILQAIADADYKFSFIEVYRQQPEFTPFNATKLGKMLADDEIMLPPLERLPGSDIIVPHVFVANESFPLTNHVMRPYPKHKLTEDKEVFNLRLRKAKTAIDGTFAILLRRWQILREALMTNAQNGELLVRVACLLHNLVREREGDDERIFKQYIEGNNYINTAPVKLWQTRTPNQALSVRNQLRIYIINYFHITF